MVELKDYLNNLEPGPVEETTQLELLLAEVWDDLGGDEGGMTGQKLVGRMSQVKWNAPVLSFSIEWHGGTSREIGFRAFLAQGIADLIYPAFSPGSS